MIFHPSPMDEKSRHEKALCFLPEYFFDDIKSNTALRVEKPDAFHDLNPGWEM